MIDYFRMESLLTEAERLYRDRIRKFVDEECMPLIAIDSIFTQFANKCDSSILARQPKPPFYWHRVIAQTLFEYLWNSKPKRFGEYFLLTDVVDAQLNPDVHSVVGNCVGLTSLYCVLGLRAGLNLTLLVASDTC